ncbi:TonB-dependent receptor [Phaeospirillum tilakii]|uniref:TonB-dependent receptor n=1 Tax=Phaeospirillum tilakii TaxID=741673 RepID=A0ABW5C7W8_9PROT
MNRHRSASPGRALRRSCAACALLAAPAPGLAQTATALPPIPVETAPVETETPSTATTETVPAEAVRAKAATTDDTARLLGDLPGVSLYTGGGLSSLPVIRGLGDDRIKTLVDGVPIGSSCPNHMNPALSYLAPSAVGRAELIAGITPVSAGGDSIAGTIRVDPKAPVFAATGEGIHLGGQVSTVFRSNASALTNAGEASVATEDVSLGVSLNRAEAGNYQDGNGRVIQASKYKSYGGDATLAFRGDGDQLVLRAGGTYTPYEGFPNQAMDLTYNRSTHASARYQGDFAWGSLDGQVYGLDIRHKMNFLFGRSNAAVGAGMPMLSQARQFGYAVKAEIPLGLDDTLRVGNEFDRFTLDEWWPATMTMTSAMGPGTFQNIAGGERNRIGTYGEWERAWTPRWTTLFGLRNDTVVTDSGPVQGYNWASGTSYHYREDAAAFNARDRTRVDLNLDLTALARYQLSDTATGEAGYARKTRSPNLYERYAWSTGSMASSMIGWFGDYNGYVGNVDLKPEVANTLSATADWHDPGAKVWQVKLTPYYTYIEDYIGADRITSLNGHAVTGTVLRFANHDAQMFGVDLSGRTLLARDTGLGDFGLGGKIGWVRGWQVNDGRNLYHLMPVNGQLTLDQRLGGWSSALEIRAVAGKTQLDTTRNEPTTPGYALVNLRAAYDWEAVTLSFGIENLFNKQYYEPLGGVDYKDARYAGQTMTTPYPALAGMGRSFDAGVTIKF